MSNQLLKGSPKTTAPPLTNKKLLKFRFRFRFRYGLSFGFGFGIGSDPTKISVFQFRFKLRFRSITRNDHQVKFHEIEIGGQMIWRS
jgi:hypothetical protein